MDEPSLGPSAFLDQYGVKCGGPAKHEVAEKEQPRPNPPSLVSGEQLADLRMRDIKLVVRQIQVNECGQPLVPVRYQSIALALVDTRVKKAPLEKVQSVRTVFSKFTRCMMKLYVLGPAFGLPSIDAECSAATALLRLRLAEGEWSIVPTSDQSRRLPYLRDGDNSVTGFKNIARYIEKSQGDVAPSLDEKQRADATALSSFLDSHAQTLLDISLYVSFDNYSTTRSAFTKVLPWHANYTLPPKRRQAARQRTGHLGISSIDVDDMHEDLSNRPPGYDVGKDKQQTFEAETQKRASLLLPSRNNTVRGLLQQTRNSAVFKLHALAENFFEPLQDMLGDSEYFLGSNEPTIIDCLPYGYLGLMLFPSLLQDWLAKTMRTKYSKLARYTERVHEQMGLETGVEAVMSLADCKNEAEVQASRDACKMKLPWEPPCTVDVMGVMTTIANDLISHIPLISGSSIKLIPSITPTKSRSQQLQRYLPGILVATTTSIALFGYYAFTTGLLVWPHGQQVHIFGRKRLADYGHLGAALAGMSLLGQSAAQDGQRGPNAHLQSPSPVKVEVDVETDDVP
ncbi:hypothetical protein LTR37_003979 [Vermiconidia calcicola]|uniref:Uncharacterized protein n=1 Tax=Vermiconidia calcicola TaxID=1690605 RepID=A0ACC3NNW4_9PEZI|nr:hypothetical protein LTR37_003979 [Vermiconidia calcicola]